MSLVGPSPKLSSTDKIISTIQHKPYADNYSFYLSEAHSEVIFFSFFHVLFQHLTVLLECILILAILRYFS